MKIITAIDFFSGMGGFAEAASGLPIKILAAYDQDEKANQTYKLNFGLKPNPRNLDSIQAQDIPSSDLWWLSPPCTPYTRRGKQLDEKDKRSISLTNLIELLPTCQPSALALENVLPFEQSQMHQFLLKSLAQSGYKSIQHFRLCPSELGYPIKRPRYFMLALKESNHLKEKEYDRLRSKQQPEHPFKELSLFLDRSSDMNPELALDPALIERYGDSLNIVDPEGQKTVLICLTKGYGRSLRASGSLIQTALGIRYLAPSELLKLFGFSHEYAFPSDFTTKTSWRLLGNSIDITCARLVLAQLLRHWAMMLVSRAVLEKLQTHSADQGHNHLLNLLQPQS